MKKIIILLLLLLSLYASSASAISANFTISQTGSNIICISTSTGNITGYKWTVITNGSKQGTTGWINSTTIPTYIYTISDEEQVVIQLCIRNNTNEICIEKGIGIVSTYKDKYPAEQYKNCKLCEDAGYYWYNNSCHEKPETLPWNIKKPLMEAEKEKEKYTIYFGEYSVDIRFMTIITFLIIFLITLRRREKT